MQIAVVAPHKLRTGRRLRAIDVEGNDFPRPHPRHRRADRGVLTVDVHCSVVPRFAYHEASHHVVPGAARLDHGADRSIGVVHRDCPVDNGEKGRVGHRGANACYN